MVPINEYQQKVFNILKEDILKAKVYDDVPKKSKLPIVVLGDYGLSNGLTKGYGYVISQNIDIYSEYEGKKEINNLVSQVVSSLAKLLNTDINKDWCIISVVIGESTIGRAEDIYIANLKFDIEIEEMY